MEQHSRPPTIFTGLFFQSAIFLLLFLSLLYNQRNLAASAILLLFITNGARLWCRLSPRKLRVELRASHQKIFPGEGVSISVIVENDKLLPVWIRAELPAVSFQSQSLDKPLVGEAGLMWFQRYTWEWEFKAKRRGCYTLGPLQINSGDLLGFFQDNHISGGPVEIVVYPRLVPLAPVILPQRDFFGTTGVRSPVEDPVYPVATREYHHGRPARHIHWKVSARHDRLQEKIHEPTAELKVMLVMDAASFAGAEADEEFERTLEVLASLAVRLESEGISVGLATNGISGRDSALILPAARGSQQLPLILEGLARLRMAATVSLNEILHGINMPWGTSCVYFSLELTKSHLAGHDLLLQSGIPVTFVTCNGSIGTEANFKIYRLEELCGGGVRHEER